MDTNRAVEVLEFFRDIDKEIKFCSRVIDDLDDEHYCLRGGRGDAPPVSLSRRSNPTESAALNVPESVSRTWRQMERRIAELREIKRAIYAKLEKLPYIQKATVYSFYVERMTLVRISMREHCSIATCKRNKDRGLRTLARLFADNELLRKCCKN